MYGLSWCCKVGFITFRRKTIFGALHWVFMCFSFFVKKLIFTMWTFRLAAFRRKLYFMNWIFRIEKIDYRIRIYCWLVRFLAAKEYFDFMKNNFRVYQEAKSFLLIYFDAIRKALQMYFLLCHEKLNF